MNNNSLLGYCFAAGWIQIQSHEILIPVVRNIYVFDCMISFAICCVIHVAARRNAPAIIV